MRYLSAALLLLAPTFIFAQVPNPTVPAAAAQTLSQWMIAHDNATSSDGCPIGFFASRQANVQMNTASDAAKNGPAQGLHLVLDRGSRPDIQSIEVTVYASSLKPRALLLNNSSPDTISKTFTLEREKGSATLDEADVWMHQVGSVRWADLVSITYTDGVSWRAMPTLKCRAVPSNFLLVGTK